ncbi:metallophosphoesterase family protein [Candidatus Micrarchaeota archaeon]|nr:metallophosphoesterase family protein [Candidatus Micrarchaeota archaeon]
MRILLIADLHSEEEVLDRLRAVHGRYDSIVVAGDIEGHDYSRRLLSISDSIKWIPGNMDDKGSCERNPGTCLHKKELELDGGLKLVGFGFSSPTPFGTPGELGEDEIYSGLCPLEIDGNTILITHVPPYGVLDEVAEGIHAGSRSLRRIMEEKKPRIIACGHVHEAEGKEKCGETTVVQIPAASTLRGILLTIENGQASIEMESL